MLLGDVARRRDNNLDALRLIAASLVIFDHAFPLAAKPHEWENILGFTLGGLAVSAFFAMSGFLIAKSWSEDPDVLRYTAKRALRLLPALVVAAIFGALVIGGLSTTLHFGDYLRNPGTRDYITHNSLVFPIRYNLPGVFANNPYGPAVNGSIWSLPIEVLAYGLVLVLGVTGLLKRRALVFAVFLAVLFVHLRLPTSHFLGKGVWFYMPVRQLWELLAMFLVGTLAYLYRDKVTLDPKVAWGLVGLMAVTLKTSMAPAVYLITVPYVLFTVGYSTLPWLRRLSAPGDVSYGIYIYAFPVQQYLAHLRPGTNPWVAAAAAFPITYALAYGSWRVIEKPALRLKRYLPGARQRALSVAPAPAAGG
jgi:peptidoglycan/LPS O-acetylase OafA/YrhL